mgnify:CR=1 FL=1
MRSRSAAHRGSGRRAGAHLRRDDGAFRGGPTRGPLVDVHLSPEVETVVSLGRVSNGKRVNVHAVVDGKAVTGADAPLILDCGSEHRGNAVTVRVIEGDTIHLSNDLDANHCFSETETVSDDSDWLDDETEA